MDQGQLRRQLPQPPVVFNTDVGETQTHDWAWPHWKDRTNISDHNRGKTINISTEMGHSNDQKYILFDKNLRSDLE